jgi:nucleoside-diphosphate-sugar epimerase
MRVLVAGATGVIGQYLVPMIIERGHEVYGTTTQNGNLAELSGLGANGVVMDGLDAESVRGVVADVRPDAIVNEMTALKGMPDFKHFDRWFAKTNELRTQGTEHLLSAAAETATVKRFVAQSYTGWTSDDTATGPATEDEAFDAHPLAVQRTTLDAIVGQERLVLDAPIDAIVLRYANLYSADSMAESIALLRKRQFPIVGGGRGIWSWLHARDAAGATVAALEAGKSGVYNVADDDPAAVNVWLPYLAQIAMTPKPMHVPAFMAKLLIGDAGVRMMTRVRGVSNAKIKRELGWRPTYLSWREGFNEIAQRQPTKELVHVPVR